MAEARGPEAVRSEPIGAIRSTAEKMFARMQNTPQNMPPNMDDIQSVRESLLKAFQARQNALEKAQKVSDPEIKNYLERIAEMNKPKGRPRGFGDLG